MLLLRKQRKEARNRIIYMIKIEEYDNLALNQKEITYKEGDFNYITKDRNGNISKEIKSIRYGGPTVSVDSNDRFKVEVKTSLNSYSDIDKMIKDLESLKSLMKEVGLKDESDPKIKEIINKEERDKEHLRNYIKENNITNPVTEALYLAELIEYRNGNVARPKWLTWD